MTDDESERSLFEPMNFNAFLSPASFWVPERFVESAWLQHAPFAFWLVDALRPRQVVELGTHHGYSYLIFCQAVRSLALNTRCSAIDTWSGDLHSGYYSNDVKRALAAYHDPRFSDFSRLIQASFGDALAHFDDKTIDLLHIDGQHDYRSVREDYEQWRPKLSDRSIILFHDTCVRDRDFGVWQLWAEISKDYPHFEFTHGHGLGVLGYGQNVPGAVSRLLSLPDSQRGIVRTVYERLGAAIEDQAKGSPKATTSPGTASAVPPLDVPQATDIHIHMAVLAPKFLDVRTYLPMRELAKVPGVTISLSERTIEIPQMPIDQPKIVIIQRMGAEPMSYWQDLLPKFLSRGWVIVSEFDDHPDLIASVHSRTKDDHGWNAVRFCHAVQTSNVRLCNAMRAYNPETQTFENAAFDIVPHVHQPRLEGRLRVFFGALNRGSISAKVGRLLASVAVERPHIEFVVVYDRTFFDALGNAPKSFHGELAYDQYLDVMAGCDIALMPLEDEVGQQFKSDLKFIEASSRGLVSIASALVYGQTIDHLETGLIVADLADWPAALMRLDDDVEMRRTLARAAHLYVAQNRMFASQINRRIIWYKSLWDRRYSLNDRLVQRLQEMSQHPGAHAVKNPVVRVDTLRPVKTRTYFFIHQNMPGQFLHLCLHLRDAGHTVVFITRNKINRIANITQVIYEPTREPRFDNHPYLGTLEDGVLHGQAVFRSINNLLKTGFRPDIVIGHAGWGETLFVKDALPHTPLVSYWEFFYNAAGQDMDFDDEYPASIDTLLSLRVKNAITLMSWAGSERGITPTRWQYSTHPAGMQAKMSVIHEGIDTRALRPAADAVYKLPNGRELRPGMKVITYVARNLEPYRGFHVFMRALPAIQRRHPDAEILIVGQNGVSYGPQLPDGDSHKKRLLAEVDLDLDRVWFTGLLPMDQLQKVFQVSAAHVYLTYPFVLSWSMLQAMASGSVVVASRTAPVEEVIVDRHNGLLVDFFDRAALVDRIDEALSNPAAFSNIRHAARATILSDYDLHSVCLPRHLSLIEDLIASR